MDRIETERLVLRPFTEDDLDDLYEYARNPNVGPRAGWEPHKDKMTSLEILEKFIEKDDVWALELRETGRVVGSLGLHKSGMRYGVNAVEVGYVLAEEQWGRGLMPEAVKAALEYAFNVLKIDVAEVGHFTFNDRSRRVIEKLGFTYEGMLRRARKIPQFGVADELIYSMTPEEYEMVSKGW